MRTAPLSLLCHYVTAGDATIRCIVGQWLKQGSAPPTIAILSPLRLRQLAGLGIGLAHLACAARRGPERFEEVALLVNLDADHTG
jgi:hypothetical protein